MSYTSWSSDFALYFQPYQTRKHRTLDTCPKTEMGNFQRYLTIKYFIKFYNDRNGALGVRDKTSDFGNHADNQQRCYVRLLTYILLPGLVTDASERHISIISRDILFLLFFIIAYRQSYGTEPLAIKAL